MIYQLQKFPHDPGAGLIGDCYRTCIACMLDLDRDEVPHFMEGAVKDAEGVRRCEAWLAERGLTKLVMAFDGGYSAQEVMNAMAHNNPGVRYMLTGESPRGTNHVVVCRDGEVEWCPTAGAVKSTEEALAGPCDGKSGWWFVNFIGKRL